MLSGTGIAGMSLDLVKAFNLLPRLPIRKLCLRLGVPPEWINTWFGHLKNVGRRFQIQGHLSEPLFSTTGFPEGDPLSIIAMLAICFVFDWHLIQEQATTTCFADNLAWQITEPAAANSCLILVLQLFRALKLEIDWNKTWFFALTGIFKHHLRQAIQHCVAHYDLQFPKVATELGMVLHFTKQHLLGTQKQRISKAENRLRKAYKINLHISDLSQLIMGGIYTVAFYGVELVSMAKQYYEKFRTWVTNALVGCRRSSNPYLVTMIASKHIVDPEFYVIQEVVRSARTMMLLGILTPEHFRFLKYRHRTDGNTIGPLTTLAHMLSRLGWKLLIDGQIETHHGNISLPSFPWKRLNRMLEQSWMEVVSSYLSQRKGLRNLNIIDRPSQLALFKDIPYDKHRMLLVNISGAHQHSAQLKYWRDDEEFDTCPYCGIPYETDSRYHEHLQCDALGDVRNNHPDHIQHLTDSPDLIYAPWFFLTQDRILSGYMHQSQPLPSYDHRIGRIQDQDMSTEFIFFYTDGSCSRPTHPDFSVAGFGIILDLAWTLEERIALGNGQFQPPTFLPVYSSACSFEQYIGRAELSAIAVILHSVENSYIITDSLFAIQALILLLSGDKPKLWKHSCVDILLDIPISRVNIDNIHHIHSHQDPATTGGIEAYHIWGNRAADLLASKARQQYEQHLTAMDDSFSAFLTQRKHLIDHYNYILEAGLTRMAIQDAQQDEAKQGLLQISWDDLLAYHLDDFFCYHTDHLHIKVEGFTWGTSFGLALLEYLSLLQWPPDEEGLPRLHTIPTDYGITWLELALGFIFHMKQWIPFYSEKKLIEADHPEYFLRLHSFKPLLSNFVNAIKQLERRVGEDLFPPLHIENVPAIRGYPVNAKFKGLGIRPSIPQHSRILSILHAYLADAMPLPDFTSDLL